MPASPLGDRLATLLGKQKAVRVEPFFGGQPAASEVALLKSELSELREMLEAAQADLASAQDSLRRSTENTEVINNAYVQMASYATEIAAHLVLEGLKARPSRFVRDQASLAKLMLSRMADGTVESLLKGIDLDPQAVFTVLAEVSAMRELLDSAARGAE